MAKGESIRTQYVTKLFLQFTLLFTLFVFTGCTTQATQSSQQSAKTEWVVQANANKKRSVIFQKKTAALKYFAEPDFVRILLFQERLFQTSIKENLQKVMAFKRPDPLIKTRPVTAEADEPEFLKG